MKKSVSTPSPQKAFSFRFITTTPLFSLFPLPQPAEAQIYNPVLPGIIGGGIPGSSYQEALSIILANIWRAAVTLGSIFFVLYFALGALNWITAGGDKNKIEEARKYITSGLIGIILIAASVAIIQLLGAILNLPFFETLVFEFPTP